MHSQLRTRYFSYCWGVFEGGGVRGSAFAGALQAAEEASITFARVAGTSAGSIVAALVAAGADADWIVGRLNEKNFRDFLKPSQPSNRLIRRIPGLGSNAVSRLVFDHGLYSSEPIADWVEALLVERLKLLHPDISPPVRFKDLAIPLHVVATDLSSCDLKIWSQEETPNDSVALAVRCSCSIPFFFQPVSFGGSLYVDGGVLSNLPAFVFKPLRDSRDRSLLSRTLCFLLTEDTPTEKIKSIKDLGLRLGASVTGGATKIQLELQEDLYPIAINTGAIRATDFDSVDGQEKEWLRTQGYEKVRNFIKKERLYLHGLPDNRTYHGYQEMLLRLVQSLAQCRKDLTIVGTDSYWLYFVFPALAFAARRGIKINAILKAPTEGHERYRQELLLSMGATINHQNTAPFEGFLFDTVAEDEQGVALISTRRGSVLFGKDYENEESKLYTDFFDRPVIANFASLATSMSNTQPQGRPKLLFEACPPELLIDRLKTVPQYDKAAITIESIPVSGDIRVLQEGVKEFKLFQVEQLVQEFLANQYELFQPLRVTLDADRSSIVTPPVLERDEDTLTVIEGHTRLFYCLRHRLSPIHAVVVHDVATPLPGGGKAYPLAELTLTPGTRSEPKNDPLRRPIESKVHPIDEF